MTHHTPTISAEKALALATEALRAIASDPQAGKAARLRAREALEVVAHSDVRQTAKARVSALEPARL